MDLTSALSPGSNRPLKMNHVSCGLFILIVCGVCIPFLLVLPVLLSQSGQKIVPEYPRTIASLAAEYRQINCSMEGMALPPAVPQRTPGRSRFSGCKLFYVDVGSNIGVQIRKLYEPSRYPSAPVIRLFDQYFGMNRSQNKELCVIGIEPNSAHTARLKALERHYVHTCGYPVHILTETAATTYDGEAPFWSDGTAEVLEWGASLMQDAKQLRPDTLRMVRAQDFSAFLQREVMPYASTIVMKMDIEGAEHLVLPHMAMRGVLCAIDSLFMEAHPSMANQTQVDIFQQTVQLVPGVSRAAACKTEFNFVDDETFMHDADNTINTCAE